MFSVSCIVGKPLALPFEHYFVAVTGWCFFSWLSFPAFPILKISWQNFSFVPWPVIRHLCTCSEVAHLCLFSTFFRASEQVLTVSPHVFDWQGISCVSWVCVQLLLLLKWKTALNFMRLVLHFSLYWKKPNMSVNLASSLHTVCRHLNNRCKKMLTSVKKNTSFQNGSSVTEEMKCSVSSEPIMAHHVWSSENFTFVYKCLYCYKQHGCKYTWRHVAYR